MSSTSIATSRSLVRGVFNQRRTMTAVRNNEEGFSLLEIAIVVALLLIASSIALLMVKNVIRSVHLQQTAANYANLLQQARVRAVQDDHYYSVITSNNSSICTSGVIPCAFVDINGDGLYTAGEPLLAFNSDVKPMASSSAPDVDNLKAQFLPSSSTWTTINITAPGPTFGPRGIPCGPFTNAGYTTCPFTTPTSFMTFMKNVRSQNWEAITVTPAGRIHLWSHGASTWSPLN
jgi:prepilin-type N-terminal cleavage/methylation domain-containing protein